MELKAPWERLVRRDAKDHREPRDPRATLVPTELRDQPASTACRVFTEGTDLPDSPERMACPEKQEKRARREHQDPRDSADCLVLSASEASRAESASRERKVEPDSMGRREPGGRGDRWDWQVRPEAGASPLKMAKLVQMEHTVCVA